MAQSFNNIGLVHRTQKNFEKAKEYYLKSLAIKEKMGDYKGMIYPLTNLSVLSQNLQKYDEAAAYINKALGIAESKSLQNEIGIQKSNLGVNYLLQGDYQEAVNYLKEAKSIFTSNGKDGTLAIIQFKLGEAYSHLNLYNKSRVALNEALGIAIRVNKLELQQNILTFLSKIEFKTNNYANAYNYLERSNAIKDSIFSAEKFKTISDIEAKYETEKKEQEIKNLNLILEKEQVQRKIWILGSLLASLIGIMLVMFLYTNKKKSQRLVMALQDRETLLKEIHHRVKNNLQIVSSLLNLQTRYIKDDSAINAVKDSKNRVNSMALIHQKLYQNDSLTGVEMNEYIPDLAETLFDSFGLNENQLTLDIEEILLDVDTVIPIGLILNELIINSIKHNNPKDISIYIGFRKNKNTLELEVKDTGKGIPENFDYSKSESYGMKLIHSLAKKLNTNVIFENDKGLKVLLVINDFKIIERT